MRNFNKLLAFNEINKAIQKETISLNDLNTESVGC